MMQAEMIILVNKAIHAADWTAIISGAVGIALGAGLNYAGLYVQRKTAVDTKQIDDRGKFTEDLMEQLENVQEEFFKYREEQRSQIAALHSELAGFKRRDQQYFRFAMLVEAELRVLNLHLYNHVNDIKTNDAAKPLLIQRAEMILIQTEKIREIIANAENALNAQPFINSPGPSPNPGSQIKN